MGPAESSRLFAKIGAGSENNIYGSRQLIYLRHLVYIYITALADFS